MRVLKAIRIMCGSSTWIEIIFLFQIIWRCGVGLTTTVRVGAVFEDSHSAQKRAFIDAIRKINLRKHSDASHIIHYDVLEVNERDSFDAHNKVCRLLGKDQGVAAIFGPASSLSAAHVQSICESFNIPHLQAHWDSRDSRDYFSISLYPHYSTLSKAVKDVITYWKWERFTILYEDNDGLIRVQDLLKGTDASNYKVTVRKLVPAGKYVHLFKELKDKGESRFVIDCHHTRCGTILHEALMVQMMSAYFHYHFTTLDIDLIDLKSYQHGQANITAFRMINPHRKQVSDLIYDWSQEETKSKKRVSPLMGKRSIELEVGLIYDAVHLFDRALTEFYDPDIGRPIQTKPFSCASVDTWIFGDTLLNYMKSLSFEGISGYVGYEQGERSNFELDLVQLTEGGLQKIGQWTNKTGMNVTMAIRNEEQAKPTIKNKMLRVAVKLETPYVRRMKNKDGKEILGRYEGFCIDLLNKIAEKLHFNYTVYEVDKFGDNASGGEWNGLIKELITKKADMALTSLTITSDREAVVDFTKPFLTLGITILFRKPEKQPPKLFSFLSPLSIEVWVYMLAAYLCVSVMLYVIARFSPYEWCNPHPCNPDTDEVENQFSMLNSLWFTIGSLMQQGCEIAPRAISTRMVSAIWWFFTLIMISSYTANLAAFLTVERMVSPITGPDDLAKQTEIKYGSLDGGSTKRFFMNSDIPTYKKMWNFMSSHPEVFVKNSEEGRQRVLDGKYAYLAESTGVEYMQERNCDLQQVGGTLDTKGYGIATPDRSPFRDELSAVILKLAEEQEIDKLKREWWKKKDKMVTCEGVEKKTKTTELSVDNVGGVFVVLCAGVVLGFFVSLCEFTWKARKNARQDQQTLCSEMVEEFRFAVRCLGSSRKTTHKKQSHTIVDNGIQFPLTGYSPNPVHREVYA